MGIESVRAYFARHGMEQRVLEFDASSATVALAALAVGVAEARIAKTLAFRQGDGAALVLAAGDAKVDNGKYKALFHCKATFLTPQEALEKTGHPAGGVCPFALAADIPVYLDISMRRFETVYPACGSANSAIGLTMEELFRLSNARDWIDVCKGWQDSAGQ